MIELNKGEILRQKENYKINILQLFVFFSLTFVKKSLKLRRITEKTLEALTGLRAFLYLVINLLLRNGCRQCPCKRTGFENQSGGR